MDAQKKQWLDRAITDIERSVDGLAALASSRGSAAPYTISELCERAGISRATVHRAVRDGKLKATRYGRAVRISPAEVDRVLQEGWR